MPDFRLQGRKPGYEALRKALAGLPSQTLLIAFHFLEIGIHDVVVGRSRCTFLSRGLGLHVRIHLLAELLRGGADGFDLGVDLFLRAGLQDILKFLDGGLDRFLLGGFQLVAVFGQRLAGSVHQRVGLVTCLREFGDFINRIGWRAQREPAAPVLADLVKAIDYQGHLAEQGDERTAANRWQNVSEFCDWIARQSEADAGSAPVTLVDMAQRISLITRLEGRDGDGDAVRLSTIHAAKGLEYPHVFLVGVEEGLLPHAGREDEDPAERGYPAEAAVDSQRLQEERLEEERRLMYVAITRAKRSLTLSWCRQRRRARSLVECQPSRFIGEMAIDAAGSGNRLVDADDAKKRLAALREMFGKA